MPFVWRIVYTMEKKVRTYIENKPCTYRTIEQQNEEEEEENSVW